MLTKALAIAAVLLPAAMAQVPSVRLHRVLTGINQPTDVQSPRDRSGRLFILEQPGRILVVRNGAILATPFLDIRGRVGCCGERGLLGLAFPLNFAAKQHFYINYTDLQGHTNISRFRVSANPDVADIASEELLLRIAQPFSNHNGGGLVFNERDGFLYIGTGDGGSGGDPENNGQRTDTLLGKMLRIDVESGVSPYAVPPSNPFANNPGYRPEIWATGLRNPWRYSFDRATGDLWIADVGQNRAEEVNYQPATSAGGENYGWRLMEGLECYPPGSACSRQGLTPPVLEYTRTLGCSVTGGFVYRGDRWPALHGTYLYGDFCTGNIWGVRRAGAGWDNQMVVNRSGASITSFGEDENGEIYVAGSGALYLVTAGAPSASANAVVNGASFAPGISPGSLATVFGKGLTSFGGVVQATATPLPPELAGTSVTLNGVAARIVGVASVTGQEQINFQVPYELAGASSATLVIAANGQQSAPVEVPLVAAQPEVFLVRPGLPAITTTPGELVTADQPAARGSVVTIYATGLGAVSDAPASGAAASSSPLSRVIAPVEVRIGGTVVPVSFAGLAPGFVGLYQVNAAVPQSAPAEAEVSISTAGATSRPVRLWVRP
jgi:uncharacterized protein (TIGR03437 family)